MIYVSLGNALFYRNHTCKRIGFDLTLQAAYVQVCAFFKCIRPQQYLSAKPGQDTALQLARGIEKEEGSVTARQSEDRGGVLVVLAQA